MLRPPSPASAEIEFLNQCESVYAAHVEIIAHVRQLAVGPSSAWSGMLGGYNTSLLCINESIGDKKRIAPDLFYFPIGQVISIPLLGNLVTSPTTASSTSTSVSLLFFTIRLMDQDDPFNAGWGKDNLFIELLRDFDPIELTHLQQPFPEFRDPRDRVVVSIRVNYIGVRR